MSHNAELAGATLDHLAGLGVRDCVVCAGARNAPLVVALLESGESGMRVWRHFDERTAAFFALGRAKKSGAPAAVLTTSGTAAAELLPAAIEAYYSGIPLMLVTADRPARFRGSGAPQAIEQVRLFGVYAPVAVDVEKQTDLAGVLPWDRRSPLHLNICLEEPEAEEGPAPRRKLDLPLPKPGAEEGGADTVSAFVANPGRLVVLLGETPEAWRAPVEDFLVRLGAPVWAEGTSGLRESEALARQLIRLERQVAKAAPRQILRIGGVPSLRFWRDLEERDDIDVLSVTRLPFSGLAKRSRLLVCQDFPAPPELAHRVTIDEGRDFSREALEGALSRHPRSEPAAVRDIARHIPEGALVFLGNSLPIREWNLAAPINRSFPKCHASRGANGIDGQVATFLGMSEDEEESWCLLGDLTALYDLNAPSLLPQLSPCRRRIVILNNAGGRIFSRLPSLARLAEEQRATIENRHARRFEAWAAMWDMEYRAWVPGEPFPVPECDTAVIEVLLDNEATEAFWRDWK